MIRRVDALQARDLIDAGVTVLEALPEAIWRREHLPRLADLARSELLPLYL